MKLTCLEDVVRESDILFKSGKSYEAKNVLLRRDFSYERVVVAENELNYKQVVLFEEDAKLNDFFDSHFKKFGKRKGEKQC